MEQIIKVRLILKKNSKILILEKSKIEGGGFSLIGGRVKSTESAIRALIRESKEEAGITIKQEKLRLVHVVHRLKKGQPVITLFFETKWWEGKIKNLEPKLHKGFEWVLLKEIPKTMTDYMRNSLKLYQEGITYSEFNWKQNNPKPVPKKTTKEK